MVSQILAVQFFKVMALCSGVFIVYLGYLLLKLGITGKFEFSMKLDGAKADLRSVSPGLLFVLLGVILCGIAVISKYEATIENGTTSINSQIQELPKLLEK